MIGIITRENVQIYLHTILSTFLDRDSDITQIAAVSDEKEFSIYIVPDKEIDPEAERLTHLKKVDGCLYYKDERVDEAVDGETGVQEFIKFLGGLDRPVLVAHNCKSFDAKVFVNQCNKYDTVPRFQRVCDGFADTLPFMRKFVEPEKSTIVDFNGKTRKRHRLSHLVNTDLGDDEFEGHNALVDSKALKSLVQKVSHERLLLPDYSFTIGYIHDCLRYRRTCWENIGSYWPLRQAGIISDTAAQRLASSGLNVGHLNVVHKYGGFIELYNLFRIKDRYNQIRVGKTREVAKGISDYFENKHRLHLGRVRLTEMDL